MDFIIRIIVSLHIFLILLIDQASSSCVFPSYMNGNWSDSRFLNVEFYDGNIMYLPDYSINRIGLTSNLSCYISEDNTYVLRTTEAKPALISNITGVMYYYYLCMEITYITDYSFYYYLQSDTDTNGERTTIYNESSTFDTLSPFCKIVSDIKLFSIMVRTGYESAALQTCSTPLLGEFEFELKNSVDTSCPSTGIWAFTDESFTTLNITYTSGETCLTKIGHSANSLVGCLVCIQNDTVYYTSMINLDSSDNSAFSTRFTCMITEYDGNNVTFTQRGQLCHEEQTASSIPDTTATYPSRLSTVGALVHLTPSGNKSSKTADCFPKTVVTETVTDATIATTTTKSSSNTTVIAVSLSVLALLVLLISVPAIIYWCKKMTKQKTSNKDTKDRANKPSGRFKFDIHTALLAGLGSSKKREKSFLKQRGSNILVVNSESKDSGPTEDVVTGYDNTEEPSVRITADNSLTSSSSSPQKRENIKQMTLPNETLSLHNHVPDKTTIKSANDVGSEAINDNSESSEASIPRDLLQDPVPCQDQQFEIDVYSDFSIDVNSESLKKSPIHQEPVPSQEQHLHQEPVPHQEQHLPQEPVPRQGQPIQSFVTSSFNNDTNSETLKQSHIHQESVTRQKQQFENDMDAKFNNDANSEALKQSHIQKEPVPRQKQQLQNDVDSNLQKGANCEALKQSHVHEPAPNHEPQVQIDRVSNFNDDANRSEQSQLPQEPAARKEQIDLETNFNNDPNNDILKKSHFLQEPIHGHEQHVQIDVPNSEQSHFLQKPVHSHEQQVQIDVPNSEQSHLLQEPVPRQQQIDFDANSNNDTSNEALKQSHLLQDPVQNRNSELQLLSQTLPLHEHIIRKPTIPILENSTEDHNNENQHIIQCPVVVQTGQKECQDSQKTYTCDNTMTSGSSDILEADKRKLDENKLATFTDEVVRIAYTDDTNNSANTTTKIDAKCGSKEQPALPNQPSMATDFGQETQKTAAANGNTVTNPVVKNESRLTPSIVNIQPDIFNTGKKHISNGQPGISTTEMGHRSSIRPSISTRDIGQKTTASGGKSIIDDIFPKMAIDMKERYKESLESRKTRNTQEQSPNRGNKMDSVSSVSDKTTNDKMHAIYASPVSNKTLQNQKKLQIRKKLIKTKSPFAKTKKT